MLDVCYGGHSFNTAIRTSLESSFVRSVQFKNSTKDCMFSCFPNVDSRCKKQSITDVYCSCKLKIILTIYRGGLISSPLTINLNESFLFNQLATHQNPAGHFLTSNNFQQHLNPICISDSHQNPPPPSSCRLPPPRAAPLAYLRSGLRCKSPLWWQTPHFQTFPRKPRQAGPSFCGTGWHSRRNICPRRQWFS